MNSKRVAWLTPSDPPHAFPDIATAMQEPDGLLAAGGDLSPERLLYAYRNGIFPWYDEGQPVLWWSPDPRCVLAPADYHVSRRLQRDIAASRFELTFNMAFADVIAACAGPRRSGQSTWITADMMRAFTALYDAGWAHSIEVRDDGELVGGVYGIAIGRVFFGESMFSARSNTSKMALLGLCRVLERHRFELVDCQVVSGHLLTLGAKTIPRQEFRAILDARCGDPTPFDGWPGEPVQIRDLAAG
ncbi:MAG: leucyl/phenylalanyl-tRNA--protein transferase [Woeseiaceae bacterium]|nr:leucyl/phenylalanyl-tRNA--protein transferase [Woeseiaceae bacterium]